MEVPSILLNRILTEAAKKNAASLHLIVGSLPMMRINNELIAIENENIVTAEMMDKIINSFITEEERDALQRDKEIVFVKEFGGSFRFRVNIFYQKKMPSISFHYIPDVTKSLSDLELPKPLSNLVKMNSGLFIVAGSYNSGKTTTAAAIVEEVNRTYKKNIITIEDPIEFLFISKKSLISQRQVGRDVKSVVQGIEHCLDEDADLVYIGEIKKEFDSAIPLILELAAGNSLVILEINADSSIRTVEKILTSFSSKTSPEAARFSLADVLLGIIVQRLIPKRGGGLVLAAEVLLATGAVKSLIREGKVYQLESVIQTSRREGMVSMSKVIEELVRDGVIKREDAGRMQLSEY
jgi:twitching motility protein PilT